MTWWYDELDCDLGEPLGEARCVGEVRGQPHDLITNGGFERPLGGDWSLWADGSAGCAATVERDSGAGAQPRGVSQDHDCECGEAARTGRSTSPSPTACWPRIRSYALTFWAKADAPRRITLSASKGAPPWDNYGLQPHHLDHRRLAAYSLDVRGPRGRPRCADPVPARGECRPRLAGRREPGRGPTARLPRATSAGARCSLTAAASHRPSASAPVPTAEGGAGAALQYIVHNADAGFTASGESHVVTLDSGMGSVTVFGADVEIAVFPVRTTFQ